MDLHQVEDLHMDLTDLIRMDLRQVEDLHMDHTDLIRMDLHQVEDLLMAHLQVDILMDTIMAHHQVEITDLPQVADLQALQAAPHQLDHSVEVE